MIDGRSVKILVVDDSKTVRSEVKGVLAPAGFDVVEAVDGIEGIERIRDTTDLALVICDVNMPRLDGIGLLKLVKAEKPDHRFRIMMLTTEGSAVLIREARDAGASAWIVKPFKPDLLLVAVRKLVRPA